MPIVFGQINLLEKGVVYPVSAAIITLDDVMLSANERGEYNMTMNPGIHRIMVGQIGMHQSRVTLKVVPGDSIRIDFQLRPDLRPL
ncbi:carboxypeptidase regulatory-like domain-containing protein [Hymenobacter perfusus]|uniref:Carboxypeptidase regulatory-like domain-containing protein n=1 Tax=Hymenobacter perfusus TaxID=1236770 RepID=A0A428K9F3_9BACT|nr:carboxypeptidase regulatory-like domain-containing protein [Hymenobacter perfusus]RSK42981.1 carboxypeptidase regulatory-like domain-containing protein [Hymenobacter perfusus]